MRDVDEQLAGLIVRVVATCIIIVIAIIAVSLSGCDCKESDNIFSKACKYEKAEE